MATKQSIIDDQKKEIAELKLQCSGVRQLEDNLRESRTAHKGTKESFRHTVDELKRVVACLEQDKAKLEGYVCRINQVDQSQLPAPEMIEQPISYAEKTHIENLNPFRAPIDEPNRFTGIHSYDGLSRHSRECHPVPDVDWFLL